MLYFICSFSVMSYCAAKWCNSSKFANAGSLSFHRFPKEPYRCRLWCEFSNRKELLLKTPHQLNNSYVLCRNHFSEDQFMNASSNRLIPFAVPTLKGTSGSHVNCDGIPALSPNTVIINSIPTNVSLKSSNVDKGCTVWSQEDITVGTRFGPFESQSDDKRKVVGNERKTTNDINPFNWLNYINIAHSGKEQNLIMFVYRGEQYCISIKDIPANTELLVGSKLWYVLDIK